MSVKQLTVTALKKRLEQDEIPLLLDVREPYEFQYASITGSLLIPLQHIPQRLGELNRDRDIVVVCHHGMRSQQAAQYLTQAGFTRVANLSGGIDAWSCECDSSVPRY